MLEFSLYCLFQSLISMPSMMSDTIFSAHVRGAFPRFISWVQSQSKEAKLVMELIKCKEDDIITVDDCKEELFCHQCKAPLVNLFITANSSEGENKLCTNCLLNPTNNDNQKRKEIGRSKSASIKYQFKCRFASPDALEQLLANVRNIIGEG